MRALPLRWCCAAICLLLVPLRAALAAPTPNPAPAARGTVIVVCGLGGGSGLTNHARAALDQCSLHYDLRQFHWGHGKGRFFHDLLDHDNVCERSAELAAEIMTLRRCDPKRRIVLLAWSGGVGVALGAAERLPPDTLDRIVLMCAACSPKYDLCGALQASRGGIVSHRCHLDQFFLTFITVTCGSIDRRHGTCAGMCGFKMPDDLSPDGCDLYEDRLAEIVWTPAMIRDGHAGNHLSYMSTRFLCKQVVHWLR
jgi:hypothetical protein